MNPFLDALEAPDKNDSEVREVLEKSRTDKKERLPSVETFLHAICQHEGLAQWVGHTHPVFELKIQCSTLGAEPFRPPYISGRNRRLRTPSGRRSLC
jgi:rhamnose utilization protein RhaD (predicted bifunctional aldolase and dehydrogenase)